MNSVGKTIAVAILMSLFSWQGASASESKAIRVSCTIPAIPGVNAPLVQQEAPRQAEQTAYAQPKERLDPGDGQDADSESGSRNEETITMDEEGQTVLVKTFYSR